MFLQDTLKMKIVLQKDFKHYTFFEKPPSIDRRFLEFVQK